MIRNDLENDKLLGIDDSEVNIDSISEEWKPVVTFNIDVEETDTYYANNILAHNVDTTKNEEHAQAQANAQGVTIPEGQSAVNFFGGFGNEKFRF